MRRLKNQVSGVSRPSPTLILGASALLLVADQLLRRIGGDGVVAGVLDETAHLMTGVLIVAACFRGASVDFTIGLLAGSVLIDADHIPEYLGYWFLTEGTDRPYTHSLVTLGILAVLAIVWRRRRGLLTGVFIGVAGHFGRDLSENSQSGVPLLWPWSYRSYHSAHWIYLAVIGLLAVVALVRACRDPKVHRGWDTAPPLRIIRHRLGRPS